MKFNIKSKKGFTLIELLVVIGILAALAAIAIPSVAGLIDRANVSADNTNANEMTNAMERFVSEYELFRQDIANGTFDVNNMDAAQSRVYNVTGIMSRADITNIEKNQTEKSSDIIGIAIYKDTKYPANDETTKKIIENYIKTSSSTFEPKQSDKHFWYSPDCGVVVVAEPEKSASELDKMIISGKDAKGNDLNIIDAQWIDLTLYIENKALLNPTGKIPANGFYYVNVGDSELGDYSNAKQTLKENDLFPIAQNSDVYVFGDYEYRYLESQNGWKATAINKSQEKYDDFLESINSKPLVSLERTFVNCSILKVSPRIPSTVVNMKGTFAYCYNLTIAPQIPKNVNNLFDTFMYCINISTAPQLPQNIEILWRTFMGCEKLEKAPEIPKSVTKLEYTFKDCKSLKTAPTIHSNVQGLSYAFQNCTSLTGKITIDSYFISATPDCFKNVDFKTQNITLIGKSNQLDIVGSTGINYCDKCNGICDFEQLH